MRRNLAHKRARMMESFELLRVSISEVRSSREDRAQGFQRTAYIRKENEEVLTFECFHELMKHIDSSKTDSQIDVLFRVLDADKNNVLSKSAPFLADQCPLILTTGPLHQVSTSLFIWRTC